MEVQTKVLPTPKGDLIISGPLHTLPDLSYSDLTLPAAKRYEAGIPIQGYSKPTSVEINSQFKVNLTQLINDLSFQDKYTLLQGTNVKKHQSFNRYTDILEDERNAVTLPEFINASWISGFCSSQANQYIATQGPLPNTIEAFWKMVWVNSVKSIFMLCGLGECENKKCEIYWPLREPTARIGGFLIRNLAETRKLGHVVRELQVEFQGEVRIVKHFHFVAWPDHGVPSELESLDRFVEDLQTEEENGKPVVVHCSAGVGRTGTLIALSQLKHIIYSQKSAGSDMGISVFSVVRRLREQRVLMVQSKEQYEILFDFVNLWIRR